MERALEHELKLDPPEAFELPALPGRPLEPRLFTSTYFDTPDQSLTRARITLRRRLENGVSRWQLKLPRGSKARTEIEELGGPGDLPTGLRELEPFTIEAILSSPYRRCVQTVEPLAAARNLTIDVRDELGEERQQPEGIALVRSLVQRKVVVCGHGGLESALGDPPRWHKGEMFVVDDRLRVVSAIRPRPTGRF